MRKFHGGMLYMQSLGTGLCYQFWCFYRCRPATETLDEGMVNINVPGQATSSTPNSRLQKLFYFGTIFRKPRSDGIANNLVRRPSGGTSGGDDMKPPIPGVRLGPLLGKGSFGSVHYGTWNGAQIAVKVSLLSLAFDAIPEITEVLSLLSVESEGPGWYCQSQSGWAVLCRSSIRRDCLRGTSYISTIFLNLAIDATSSQPIWTTLPVPNHV